jgi:hypothetical protein
MMFREYCECFFRDVHIPFCFSGADARNNRTSIGSIDPRNYSFFIDEFGGRTASIEKRVHAGTLRFQEWKAMIVARYGGRQ